MPEWDDPIDVLRRQVEEARLAARPHDRRGADREVRPTVTVDVAAEVANVSRRTIYHWMQTDRVQFIRTAGGGRRIYLDSLFIAGNTPVAGVRIPRRRRGH